MARRSTLLVATQRTRVVSSRRSIGRGPLAGAGALVVVLHLRTRRSVDIVGLSGVRSFPSFSYDASGVRSLDSLFVPCITTHGRDS